MSDLIARDILEREKIRRCRLLNELILNYEYDGLFKTVDEIEELLDFIDAFNRRDLEDE